MIGLLSFNLDTLACVLVPVALIVKLPFPLSLIVTLSPPVKLATFALIVTSPFALTTALVPCPSLKVKLSPGLITVLAVASSPCFNWKPDFAIASATALLVVKPSVVGVVTAPVASVTVISPVLAATVWVFKCSPSVGVTVIKSLPLTSTASFAVSFTSFLVTLT